MGKNANCKTLIVILFVKLIFNFLFYFNLFKKNSHKNEEKIYLNIQNNYIYCVPLYIFIFLSRSW